MFALVCFVLFGWCFFLYSAVDIFLILSTYVDVVYANAIDPSMLLFQTVFGRRRIQTFYDQCIFRAGTGVALSQSRFVTEFEKAYKNDKEGLIKELRAGYKSTITILDMNLSCKLDSNEVILGMSSGGLDDPFADLKYFNSFNNAQGIPVSDYIDAIIRFYTSTDETNDENNAETQAMDAFIERSNLTLSSCYSM